MEDWTRQISNWKRNKEPMKVDFRQVDDWVVTFTFDGDNVDDKDERVIIQRPGEAYISFRKDAVRRAEEHNDGFTRLHFDDGHRTFMDIHEAAPLTDIPAIDKTR